ncbi:MAG TPA: hypothetical protein VK600_00830 [Candidatus Saccharimonadales bacterium]|nr:hypothetical protein [Candidatus Saccharimonadales bacterium]
MTQTVGMREWRRYGFGGPPEPWEQGAQRDLDRLATSYYLEILTLRGTALAGHPDEELWLRIEELSTTATRHKHEIDYTLRHWATPAERARVTDRLGSLMRISRRLHTVVHGPDGESDPEPEAA